MGGSRPKASDQSNEVIEDAFHEAVCPERILDMTLYKKLENKQQLKLTLKPFLVYSSTGLKYFISFGSKNMYLMVAFFLWHLSGYPVKIIRFNKILSGSGYNAIPVATMSMLTGSFALFVKQRTFDGW